ncbi:MAG: TIGR02757 family protein [Phycisphaerae bacterium]|nr:TIGR02757 family protein [Phycisphaerae bacterium]
MTSPARTCAASSQALRDVLDRVYERYNRRQFLGSDPLQFAHRYSNRQDVEIAAFLASALAYGRVEQIKRSLTQLFDRMDNTPYEFTSRFDNRRRARLRSFKHRFTTGDDLADLLGLFRQVLDRHGSLEAFFLQGYRQDHDSVLPALNAFCESLGRIYRDSHGGNRPPAGLSYLLASPSRGSASKRLNLFLRWMVRKDDVDLGLWTSIDKAGLIVPVDVHMGRLCRILGLHAGKSACLRAAVEITAGFARIEPADPVKYDFALSRIGIVEDCTGRRGVQCQACALRWICEEREYRTL